MRAILTTIGKDKPGSLQGSAAIWLKMTLIS